MYYADYKGVRDAAWHLLVDLNIQRLPVRMTNICKELGIIYKAYVPKDDREGLAFIIKGQPVILVAAGMLPSHQRVTAAHELGHILLGHVGKFSAFPQPLRPANSPIEQAADMFAGRLVAPACVLWGCNARTPEQIAKLCDISMDAARLRADRMKVLYKREKFLSSPLEKKVYQQFEAFIAENQL